MPARNGTGPQGNGANTGRGMGPCSGDTKPFAPRLGRRNGRRGRKR